MANLRGRMARGQKSGAFALGFSDKMKAVASAAAVLALATTGTVVVQAQTAPAAMAQQTDAGEINTGTRSVEVTSPGVVGGRYTISGDAQYFFRAPTTGNIPATFNRPDF